MGQCTLGKLLAKACQTAGIKGKKTNHSLRKTCVKELSKAGVQDTAIMKITGHKSMSSLMHYNEDMEIEDHRQLSNILCSTSTSTKCQNQKQSTTTETEVIARICRSQTTTTTTSAAAAAPASVATEIESTRTMTMTTASASSTTQTTISTTNCGTSTTLAAAENQTFCSRDNPLSGPFVFSCTFNNCTIYFKLDKHHHHRLGNSFLKFFR